MQGPRMEMIVSCEFQSIIIGDNLVLNKLYDIHKKFFKFLKDKQTKLFLSIEKYSGFKWKKELYKVWLFYGNQTQMPISFPIMLNCVIDDMDCLFFTLIHELVHNNLMPVLVYSDNKYFKYDMLEIEALVNLITKYVVRDFYGKEKGDELCLKSFCSGIYSWHKYVWKRVAELEKEIHLNTENLKEYLSNKKEYVLKNEDYRW